MGILISSLLFRAGMKTKELQLRLLKMGNCMAEEEQMMGMQPMDLF